MKLWHTFWLRWHIRRQHFEAAAHHFRVLHPQRPCPPDIKRIINKKLFDLL